MFSFFTTLILVLNLMTQIAFKFAESFYNYIMIKLLDVVHMLIVYRKKNVE
jgi:hypothetical protein